MKKNYILKSITILLILSSCSSNRNISKNINDTVIMNNNGSNDNNNKINKSIEEDYSYSRNDIIFLKTIYFDFESYKLTSEAKRNLNLLIKYLTQENNKDKTILLSGHCDNVGTEKYNYKLGLKRTKTAKEYLINKGINEKRIKTISYGKRDNERKVEIDIIK